MSNDIINCAHAAYAVFIMYEHMHNKGLLNEDDGLDKIWEQCILEYTKFLKSKHNKFFESEYDCITNYINAKTK